MVSDCRREMVRVQRSGRILTLVSCVLRVWGGAVPRRECTLNVCSRGAQRVLRYGDMEHVMLHLIFSLPHAWGGTTCSVRCIRSLILERILLVAHYLPVRFRQSDLDRDALFAIEC